MNWYFTILSIIILNDKTFIELKKYMDISQILIFYFLLVTIFN